MVIRLVLEHHNPKLYDNLRSQLEERNNYIALLERKIADLEIRYGAEIHYNAALCDLLRDHAIPYRDVFSHDERYTKGT